MLSRSSRRTRRSLGKGKDRGGVEDEEGKEGRDERGRGGLMMLRRSNNQDKRRFFDVKYGKRFVGLLLDDIDAPASILDGVVSALWLWRGYASPRVSRNTNLPDSLRL